ncbi:MAG: hypothetical protein LBN02_05450 [Oscillospiraceae bacterium]|jgi:hypothetical protein|nr:hypothetical protein [Oscillospiraceae bacterium]
MKKSLALSLCLLLAFSLFACKTTPAATTTPNTQQLTADEIRALDESETKRGGLAATLSKRYETIAEITADAELIVRVEVLNVEPLQWETFMGNQTESEQALSAVYMTHTTFKVLSVIKGDAAVGDVLKVRETSGGQGFAEYTFGGIPAMVVGGQYILFLNEEYEGMRGICGIFGRFIEKQGYMVQQTVEEAKIKSYTPLPTEQFMQLYSGLRGGRQHITTA